MSKKRNWDKISSQSPTETVSGRDVYEDQQMDRGKISEKQSPTSRIVFVTCVALLVMFVTYFGIAFAQFVVDYAGSASGGLGISSSQGVGSGDSEYPYILAVTDYVKDEEGITTPMTRYYACDKDGNQIGEGYEKPSDVPVPEWYAEYSSGEVAADSDVDVSFGKKPFSYFLKPDLTKVLGTLIAGLIVFALLYEIMMRNLDAQNMLSDTSDINQYQNDRHIQLPEEIQRSYDWFPDVGAHSDVLVSSLISHVALKNKGLKRVKVPKRAKKDIIDDDGDVIYYEGEVLLNDDGNPIYETKPVIDEGFMDALFDASGAPKGKKVRKRYDTTKIPYNPDNQNREKLKGYNTVADLINGDWELPDYEPQRPAGAYIVDTEPVNTMVLAITRAGKGQTIIE